MDETKTDDAEKIRAWWKALQPREAAALRHAGSLVEVAVQRQGLALARSLSWARYRPEHAAGLAQILAHVKDDDRHPIMRR